MMFLGIVALNVWAGLRAGAGSVEITAPLGAAMAGYFFNRAATAVHDPLWARALVLENAGVRIALVSCDLTHLPEEIAAETRRLIAARTGIAASHVMITATHAHSAPVVLGGWTRYQLEGEMKRLGEEYAAGLPARIARAVEEAAAQMRPARLLAGTGQEPSLAFHRRYWMKDGSIGWNPGKGNPNIVRPAGPIDPAVPLVLVEGEDGKAIAVYVNYAMHLDTVGGTEYSADYVHALSEAIRLAKGPQVVTLFSMGCAGNINHVNTAVRRRQSGHGEAARIGVTLAAEVLRRIEELEAVEDLTLEARQRRVSLQAVVPTEAEIREAHETGMQGKPTPVLARMARTRQIEARQGRPFEAEVQVLRVGKNLVWVGLPGEVFVELGLDLKNRSSARWTMVATQTNGALGYIPHRAAYPQGNYEVVSARVAAGSGELLVDTALQMMEEGKSK